MYVSLCSVLPPANWSAYLPNKGNSLLTYCHEDCLLRLFHPRWNKLNKSNKTKN